MPMNLPLTGIRVLDLSTLLPGPFATQMLADLGADVLKVEAPGGDLSREVAGDLFEVANRNKRALRLDLKDSGARSRFLELAAETDVVVEGFRPGVAARLGVAYDDVREHNPAVVYCSISGYGQTGPMSDRPGHDLVFLAASGALSVPGHWHEPARRSGVPLSDLAASSYAAISILVALRHRDATGEGTHLDVAIRDAALAYTSSRAGRRLDRPAGDVSHLYPANDLFTTLDGRVVAIAALEDHFLDRLREGLGDVEPELREPRFEGPDGKRANAQDMHELVRSTVSRLTEAELLARLHDADVPAEAVRSVRDAADLAEHRGVIQRVDGQRHVVFPVLVDGEPLGRARRTAPRSEQATDWLPR